MSRPLLPYVLGMGDQLRRPSVWAVENSYLGGKWRPAEGALFTSRDRARRHLRWAQRMMPPDTGWAYRVQRYVSNH